MLKLRTLILTAVLGGSSLLLLATPASASCTEWFEGRCLENDVCTLVGQVRPVDCID